MRVKRPGNQGHASHVRHGDKLMMEQGGLGSLEKRDGSVSPLSPPHCAQQ